MDCDVVDYGIAFMSWSIGLVLFVISGILIYLSYKVVSR